MKGWFSKFFPTPIYLLQPSVGVDLSDHSIKYLSLLRARFGYKIGQFGEKELPEGYIKEGLIQNSEKIVLILKEISKDFLSRSVRISLPEEATYLFQTSIPKMTEGEIRETIAFQLEKNVPIPPGEAIFDFDIFHESENEYHLQVAVMDQSVVLSYLDIFERANLVPISFELEPQAIARSVVAYDDQNTYMIVDFGETRTGISVVDSGKVLFTTNMEIGGEQITKSLMSSLGIDLAKAQELKYKYGLRNDPEIKKAYPLLLKIVEDLAFGINTHFQYWQSHQVSKIKGGKEISKVIFCGGNSNLRDFFPVLKEKISVPIIPADPWVNLYRGKNASYVPQVNKKKAQEFVGALGLALGDYLD